MGGNLAIQSLGSPDQLSPLSSTTGTTPQPQSTASTALPTATTSAGLSGTILHGAGQQQGTDLEDEECDEL